MRGYRIRSHRDEDLADHLGLRGAALRGAQLDLLAQNRIENEGDGLPSTWEAFVLDGD